jgi:hypothetical protein
MTSIGMGTLDFPGAGQAESFFCSAPALHFWHLLLLTLWFGCFAFSFLLSLRGKDHNHRSSFHVGGLIDLRNIAELLRQSGEKLLPLFFVGDFPALENDACFHFVPFHQKPPGMSDLEVEIVNIGVRVEAKFLEQGDMLMLLLNLVLLRQFVLEFPEVDDFADRRLGIRYNLDKVCTPFPCHRHCLGRSHDAKLSPVVIDYPDLWNADFIIDAVALLFADGMTSYGVMVFSAISRRRRASISSSPTGPRSPFFLCRTATEFEATSRSPRTSI